MLLIKISLAALLVVGSKAGSEPCRSDLRVHEWVRPDFQSILSAGSELRSDTGERLQLRMGDAQRDFLKKFFGRSDESASRLEQFYALLFWMTEIVGSSHHQGLEVKSVQKLMRSSKAFQSPELIDSIERISVSWDDLRRAQIKMKLSRREIVFPLNLGKGFRAFQHGFCQHAQKLIVYDQLDLSIDELRNGNIEVTFHDPVDLEGELGTRGVVDLDLHYIRVLRIEFLQGSRLAKTRARISPREFASHQHPWWLRWISRLVSESATQPIDW